MHVVLSQCLRTLHAGSDFYTGEGFAGVLGGDWEIEAKWLAFRGVGGLLRWLGTVHDVMTKEVFCRYGACFIATGGWYVEFQH